MRWSSPILICWCALFCALSPAFSQNAPAPSAAAAAQSGGDGKKGGAPVYAQVGGGNLEDYQKDNPLLKTDTNKTSNFQGKMFPTKDFKLKQFEGAKEQPIVLNKMYTQNSNLTSNKNSWQDKEKDPYKKSDLINKQSTIADKRANVGGEDVSLKMVKGFDGKTKDAKIVSNYSKIMYDSSKRYEGPESPQSFSEMEMIKERLKTANSPEELKKNQLTTDEVQKLLQPGRPLTRAKALE